MIPLKDGLSLIQSTDFFYPLISDPYMMGKITCANVVSDVYAMGVTEIDSLHMIISCCEKMSTEQQDIVLPLIIKGFQDNVRSLNIKVILNSAVINPWCMIGGTATSVCKQEEYIKPVQANVGDVLVLTKPLGAQISCNAHRWSENEEKWKKLAGHVTLEEVRTAFDAAIASMARLNHAAAVLMHKYEAHGATDVTGFGILGHAENLAKFQLADVDFVIHTLPTIKNVSKIAEAMGSKEKFLKGRTPETSGGLLVILKEDVANDYCRDIEQLEKCQAWIVGNVIVGSKTARISSVPNVVETTL